MFVKDGKPYVLFSNGEISGEGFVIGWKISDLRADILKHPECTKLGPEVVVATGDTEDEAWKAEAGEDMPMLVSRAIDGGVQMIEYTGKVVSEDCIIREADILVTFREPKEESEDE